MVILKTAIPLSQFQLRITNPQDKKAFQRYPSSPCAGGRVEEPHQEHRSGEESHRKSTYHEIYHHFFYLNHECFLSSYLPYPFFNLT